MALIKCPECGNQISDTTKACIHCGYGLKKETVEPKAAPKVKEVAPSSNQLKAISNANIWIISVIPLISILGIWVLDFFISSFYITTLVFILIIAFLTTFLITQDYNNIKESGIDTKSLGKVNMFYVIIPKYLYQRTQLLKQSIASFVIWIISFVIFILVVFTGFNPLNMFLNSSINLVKEGTLYSCPGHTVGEIVDSNFSNVSWESKTNSLGDEIVEVSGKVRYAGLLQPVTITYLINDGEFYLDSLELSHVTQSTYQYTYFMDNMCDNTY